MKEKSVLGAIKKYQAEDKEKPKEKEKKHQKKLKINLWSGG